MARVEYLHSKMRNENFKKKSLIGKQTVEFTFSALSVNPILLKN